MSSFKYTPEKENWDDDFLFQTTPSKPSKPPVRTSQAHSHSSNPSIPPNEALRTNPYGSAIGNINGTLEQAGSQPPQTYSKQSQYRPEPKGLPSSESFSSHLSGWDSPPASPERVPRSLPCPHQNNEPKRERESSVGVEDWDEEFQLAPSPPSSPSISTPIITPAELQQPRTIFHPETPTLSDSGQIQMRQPYSPPVMQEGLNPYRTFSSTSVRQSSTTTSSNSNNDSNSDSNSNSNRDSNSNSYFPPYAAEGEKNKPRGGLMARVHSLHKRFSSPGVPTRKDLGVGEMRNQQGGQGMGGMGRRMDSIGSMLDRLEMMPGSEDKGVKEEISHESSTPTSPKSFGREGGRLPTSPSLVSVGFHLPSPSPASPYYTGRSNEPENGVRHDIAIEKIMSGDEETPRRARIRSGNRELTLDLDKARDFSGSSTGTKGTMGTMGTMGSFGTEDARMDVFRMASPVDREGRLEAMGLPVPVGKRKSTLRRLSSMGKKHGRKVSDGWRLVSGSGSGNGNGNGGGQGNMNAQMVTLEKKGERGPVLTPKTAPVSFSQYQTERITPPPPLPSPMKGNTRLAPPIDLNVTSGSMRNMSCRTHAPSPSASRISSDPQATRSPSIVPKEEGARSPSSAGVRRVSLSDLKIPSRVASTQKGLKEGIQAVKQFAGCVADLKALVAQRAIIESNPTYRSGKEEYARWWDQAHVLIQLGETGSTPETPPRTPPMRERRITLIGDLKEPVMAETSNGNSVGKKEFSEKEVDILRDILQSPGLEDRQVKPKTILPQPPISPLSPTQTTNRPSDRRSSKPAALVINKPFTSTTKQSSTRMKENLPILSPLQIPNLSKDIPPSLGKQRRSSRSGFFNLRDMWRNGGKLSPTSAKFSTSRSMKPPRGSESSEEKREMKKDVVRSPVRPGLASLFRRSSGEAEIKAMKRKSSSSILLGKAKADKDGKKEKVGGRSSIASSISDWDNFEAQNPAGAATPKDAEGEGDKDRTIGRSDSRRMLANLGINPEASPRRNHSISGEKNNWNPAIGRGNNSPTVPPSEGMKNTESRPTLVLTPDNLVPLLNQARTTIKMCKESLENSRMAGRA